GPHRSPDAGRSDVEILVRVTSGSVSVGVPLRGVRARPERGGDECSGGRPLRWRDRSRQQIECRSFQTPTQGDFQLMAKWLTQEWLDQTRKMAESQPERPGASARMQYVVTGGPEGEIKYYWVLENGKLLDSQLG